jgi:nitrite reductase/ring-hydroxylating ferredoxin subunit
MSSIATAALGTAAIATGAAALAIASHVDSGIDSTLLPPLLPAVGSMLFIKEQAVYLVRTPEGLGALSARCTHLGCLVRQNGRGFVCPCHGARYDGMGRVTAGPAPRDLPWLAVQVRADGAIAIDRRREVAAGTVAPLAPRAR